MNPRTLFTSLLLLSGIFIMPDSHGWEQPRSGYEWLPPEIREMQDDLFANPGMFTVDEGRELFNTPGYEGRSCASCHGRDGMRLDPTGIAGYPIYDEARDGPLTLQQRINDCRENRVGEFPLPYDDAELVTLETFVRFLARGEEVKVDVDGPLRPFYREGESLYRTRIGQLQIACTHCHDRYVGTRLRDQVLNQGQPNGFPAFRILTGEVSSLQHKLRDCFATLRAMPYPVGSEEFINLEVYLNARSNGLPIETPGVRR